MKPKIISFFTDNQVLFAWFQYKSAVRLGSAFIIHIGNMGIWLPNRERLGLQETWRNSPMPRGRISFLVGDLLLQVGSWWELRILFWWSYAVKSPVWLPQWVLTERKKNLSCQLLSVCLSYLSFSLRCHVSMITSGRFRSGPPGVSGLADGCWNHGR